MQAAKNPNVNDDTISKKINEENPQKPLEIQPNTEQSSPNIKRKKKHEIQEDDDDEVQENPIKEPTAGFLKKKLKEVKKEEEDPMPSTSESTAEFLKRKLKEVKKDDHGNETLDPEPKREPLYIPPDLSPEALVTNTVLKSFVNYLETLSEHIGKTLKKSDLLASAWKTHITQLDGFIKSLSGLPWKRVIGYSACLFTLGFFVWKMGVLRMIPNFGSNLISLLPNALPSAQTKDVIPEIPKPNIENTMQAIMHTPLTPLAIVGSVATIAVVMGSLKMLVWVLHKAPK